VNVMNSSLSSMRTADILSVRARASNGMMACSSPANRTMPTTLYVL